MPYRELVIEIGSESAEAFSDALLDAGALSVSVEDADADTPAEQPLFGEPGSAPAGAWNHSRLVALMADSAEPRALLERAVAESGLGSVPAYTSRQVEDQDWVRLTQAQFDPIRIGQRIWVVPSWHVAPDPAALVLELDPGLAFGTGSHPTTRLCMEWLEHNIAANQSMLDYGCGSGILAILASKCGAAPVIGIDIDPQAVTAARANTLRNHAQVEYGLPDDFQDSRYDVVVANILSNPLKLMASMLAAKVQPGGRLVLSGILQRQAEEVATAYAPWINMSVWAAADGWVCLAGRK